MKKLSILVIVLLLLVIAACSRGPADAECEAAMFQMRERPSVAEPLDPAVVRMILNTNHAPGTVGAVLRECIENGWEGYR